MYLDFDPKLIKTRLTKLLSFQDNEKADKIDTNWYRLKDWPTDRLTDGLTDRQMDWQTDGQTDRLTDWQTET